MIKDTRSLIDLTKDRIKELYTELRKRQYYLDRLIDDKEELTQVLNDYEKLDIYDVEIQVLNIYNVLKLKSEGFDKESINKLIHYINSKILEVKKAAESYMFRISEYKSVLNLFDIEKSTLKNVIESIEVYETILKILNEDKEMSILNKNMILQELNKQNLQVLKKRDEINRKKSKIETAKKIATKKLKEENKHKEEPYTFADQEILLTKEQEDIVKKCKSIIQTNQEIINEGFNNEINEAYELGLESNETLIGALDTDEENYLLIIREIYGYLKEFNTNKDISIISKLEIYLKYYSEYEEKVLKERLEKSKIKKLEEDKEDLLAKIVSIVTSYQKQCSKLTEDDLNRIESVRIYLRDSVNLTDEDRINQVNSICTSSNIDYKVYQELTLQSEIADGYETYLMEEEYEEKKELLEDLENLINEYLDFIETTRLINISEEKEEIKENILLYLPNPTNTTCIEDFYYKGKTEVSNNVKRLKKALKEFNTSSRNIIFTKSEGVKSDNKNTKIRKVRYGDIRVIYVDINAFGNLSLPISKPCYLILTCGPKHGRTEIYDYVNSKYVTDLMEEFFNSLREMIESIKVQNLSEEETQKQILVLFNDFVDNNHKLYEQTIKNISNTADTNDLQLDSKTGGSINHG